MNTFLQTDTRPCDHWCSRAMLVVVRAALACRSAAAPLASKRATLRSTAATQLVASFKVLKPSFATKRLHSIRNQRLRSLSQKTGKKPKKGKSGNPSSASVHRLTTPGQSESVGHRVVRAAGKCGRVRDESAAGEFNHRWPCVDKCIEIQNSSKIAAHD